VRPMSVVFDTRGIYFDPSRPSDLEHLLATRQFTAAELTEARSLREFIVANGLTKYNTDPWPIAGLPTPDWVRSSIGRRVVLVPGQVEDDASVRLGGGAIQTTAQLLAAVRAAEPEAFIVYRPHPDVMAGNRNGVKALPPGANAVDAAAPLLQLIAFADEVHVLTSLSGFDALLRGKRVVTYGSPFYAGWGLTDDCGLMPDASTRRARKLMLDELVAGSLGRYASYVGEETARPHSMIALAAERIVMMRTPRGTAMKTRVGCLLDWSHAWFGENRKS
jgi:capsular polysaccharide export protein